MTRVAAYYRISSDPTGKAEGVERQKSDVAAKVAGEDGWTLEPRDEYEENDTGASRYSRKPRKKYAALIERARNGDFDVILAYSMSRLTRAPRELEDLIDLAEKHGVRVITLNSFDYDLNDPMQRYFARQEAARDANEADLISQRVRRQVKQRKERGEFVGGARAFGWGVPEKRTDRDGNEILSVKPGTEKQANETEQAMIRDAAEHVIAGRSMASLIREWNARKPFVSTVRGAKWQPDALKTILRQETNVPDVLDPDTAATVVAMLSDTQREWNRGNALVHWLSGVPVCSKCDARMLHGTIKTRGIPFHAYRCPTGHNTIKADTAERIVSAAVAQWYFLGKTDPAREQTGMRSIAEIQRDRAAVMDERSGIEEAINAKAVTLKGMLPTLTELAARLDALDAELQQVRQSDAHESMTEAAVLDVETKIAADLTATDPNAAPFARIVALRRIWDELAVDSKKRLLLASFSVVVNSGKGSTRVKVSRNGIDLTADDADITYE